MGYLKGLKSATNYSYYCILYTVLMIYVLFADDLVKFHTAQIMYNIHN